MMQSASCHRQLAACSAAVPPAFRAHALQHAAAPPFLWHHDPFLQLSALTRLRILYLHGIATSDAVPPEPSWDTLRPLTALRFLAISGNSLPQLPAAVAAMTHLRVGGPPRCRTHVHAFKMTPVASAVLLQVRPLCR